MILQTAATPHNTILKSTSDEPTLEAGDHLEQAEFHRRYGLVKNKIKAELIGGIVYMQTSLKRAHGRAHNLLTFWLRSYENETPGVEAYDNATTIMGNDCEPQPDACLILLPKCGGQTQFSADDYLQGAPEFVGEVASSSESYDLHSKKKDYERLGVKEYLVIALRQQRIYWFVNRDRQFEEMPVDSNGYYRSIVFPGLWLDPVAFLALDGKKLKAILQLGIESAAHSEFVKRLSEE